MKVLIAGSADNDELLSLKFAQVTGEDIPSTEENLLCDGFRTGAMAVKLIETFGRGGKPDTSTDDSTDFVIVAEVSNGTVIVIEAYADRWPLDAKYVANALGLKVS